MALPRLTEKQVKEDAEQQLRKFKRTKDFLVAIDTDGCVTDNMSGKQVLIFHPQFMEFYQLWEIESYYREVAEYYNLFSVDRGCNRFIAIQFILTALEKRKDVQKILTEKHIKLPEIESLSRYISYTRKNKLGLGNPTLEEFLNQNPLDLALYKLLGWSEAVNRTFPHISVKIPPFDNVSSCLKLMAEHADILIVSKTPYADLANYWESQEIDQYVQMIAGQEMGSKGHHIEVAKKAGNYDEDQVMMIGDGGGDLKAVKVNRGLFYPTPPGLEKEAWKNFPDAFEKFIKREYRGKYEETLLISFNKVLLTSPPWLQADYNHIEAYKEKQNLRKDLYEKFNPEGRLLIL